MVIKILIWEAPSTQAASLSSVGMEFSNVFFMIMKFVTPMALGITIDHMVLSMPKFFTTMYVGIRPPENIMVNMIILEKNFRPTSLFSDSAYAPMVVSSRFSPVPTAVYRMELSTPRFSVPSWNTLL